MENLDFSLSPPFDAHVLADISGLTEQAGASFSFLM